MEEPCPDPTCPLGSRKEAWSLVAEVSRATADIRDIKTAIHGNGRFGMLYDLAAVKLTTKLIMFVLGIVFASVVALVFGVFSKGGT